VHDGLFRTLDDGSIRLLGGYSPTSGKHHFPVQSTCPYSGATDIETVELSAEGTLWGWTAVTAAPPGYLGEVPFGFGVVELPEGIRIITRVEEPDPSALEHGMAMRLVPATLDDDVVTYSFAPA
jgi:uncharacterized OB-fold protein